MHQTQRALLFLFCRSFSKLTPLVKTFSAVFVLVTTHFCWNWGKSSLLAEYFSSDHDEKIIHWTFMAVIVWWSQKRKSWCDFFGVVLLGLGAEISDFCGFLPTQIFYDSKNNYILLSFCLHIFVFPSSATKSKVFVTVPVSCFQCKRWCSWKTIYLIMWIWRASEKSGEGVSKDIFVSLAAWEEQISEICGAWCCLAARLGSAPSRASTQAMLPGHIVLI